MRASRAETASTNRREGKGLVCGRGARLWIASACIAVVLCVNVQCALAFLVSPADYVGAFQLDGIPGMTMVRSLGLVFLMWNVPYVLATWHPKRYLVSLIEATIMQGMGLSGEMAMLWALPDVGYGMLRATGRRFVCFDAVGLALLIVALGCVVVWDRRALSQHRDCDASRQS